MVIYHHLFPFNMIVIPHTWSPRTKNTAKFLQLFSFLLLSSSNFIWLACASGHDVNRPQSPSPIPPLISSSGRNSPNPMRRLPAPQAIPATEMKKSQSSPNFDDPHKQGVFDLFRDEASKLLSKGAECMIKDDYVKALEYFDQLEACSSNVNEIKSEDAFFDSYVQEIVGPFVAGRKLCEELKKNPSTVPDPKSAISKFISDHNIDILESVSGASMESLHPLSSNAYPQNELDELTPDDTVSTDFLEQLRKAQQSFQDFVNGSDETEIPSLVITIGTTLESIQNIIPFMTCPSSPTNPEDSPDRNMALTNMLEEGLLEFSQDVPQGWTPRQLLDLLRSLCAELIFLQSLPMEEVSSTPALYKSKFSTALGYIKEILSKSPN